MRTNTDPRQHRPALIHTPDVGSWPSGVHVQVQTDSRLGQSSQFFHIGEFCEFAGEFDGKFVPSTNEVTRGTAVGSAASSIGHGIRLRQTKWRLAQTRHLPDKRS